MASRLVTARAAAMFYIDREGEVASVEFADDAGGSHTVQLTKAEAFAALTASERSAVVSIMNKWSAAAHAKRGFSE